MPSYDFRCKECDHKFTKSLSYQDKDKVLCSECGGKVTQLFTGFLFSKSGQAAAASGGGCSKSSCSGCSGC